MCVCANVVWFDLVSIKSVLQDHVARVLDLVRFRVPTFGLQVQNFFDPS